MRIAASGLALLLMLASPICRAGEVPDPLFWATEDDFHRQVGSGQFIDRLELHLLQYASDPGWRLDWAAAQHAGNGLFGEYGSTTGTDLHVDSQVALNVFPAERFQVRYDRRDWQDGRFELTDQRFDAVGYAGPGWGVVLSGWPTFDKELASLGVGLRLGAPRSRNALDLRVLSERFVWNEKTGGDVRFTRGPVRLVVDGYGEAGPWRIRGSSDWGLSYEAEDSAAGRATQGLQRFADVEAQYQGAGWAAGARLTGIVLRRSQTESTGAVRSLHRSWGRAVASFRRELGTWSVSALAGWDSQRDDFSSPDEPSGAYAADSLLVGAEGGWQASRVVQLRLGYLGSWHRAERGVSGGGPLPARSEREYLDKAHVRALFAFGPGMAIEFLLSQALHGGSFGGGSIKALFVL